MFRANAGIVQTWYVPSKLFTKKTNILIVDDVMRTKTLLKALSEKIPGKTKGFEIMICANKKAEEELSRIAPVNCFMRCEV